MFQDDIFTSAHPPSADGRNLDRAWTAGRHSPTDDVRRQRENTNISIKWFVRENFLFSRKAAKQQEGERRICLTSAISIKRPKMESVDRRRHSRSEWTEYWRPISRKRMLSDCRNNIIETKHRWAIGRPYLWTNNSTLTTCPSLRCSAFALSATFISVNAAKPKWETAINDLLPGLVAWFYVFRSGYPPPPTSSYASQ